MNFGTHLLVEETLLDLLNHTLHVPSVKKACLPSRVKISAGHASSQRLAH